jgi:hypothetical protein
MGRRRTGSWLAVCVALALAGCESGLDLFDQPRAATETFVQITDKGAGALDANVPYNAAAISARLPGFTADRVLVGLERATATILVLFKEAYGGRVQALQIVPGEQGRIAEIHGVTHHVVGPGGERPGMTLRQTRADPATCRPAEGLWVGMAICRSRAAPNVALAFSFRGPAAASPTLPDATTLSEGELQRIIWTPPAPVL